MSIQIQGLAFNEIQKKMKNYKINHQSNHFIALLLSILIITNLCSCGGGDTKNYTETSGQITISGAFALYPLTVKWADEYKKLYPNVRIDISAGGAGKGMTDALSGMIDLGMFSREITQAELDKGVWWVAVAKDAVLPVVNSGNKNLKAILEQGLSKEEFMGIFISQKIKFWGEALANSNKEKITVFTRSDACGAAEMWAKYLGQNQENLEGVGVFGDPGMSDAVKKDVNAIGYNNAIYVFDYQTRKLSQGIQVVPLDINGNNKIDPDEQFYDNLDSLSAAIKSMRFPSPPARNLYFVAKGKPLSKTTLAFINWILKDGQKYIHEAGYIELSDSLLVSGKQKVQ